MAPTYPGQHEDEERERKRQAGINRAEKRIRFGISIVAFVMYAITRVKFIELGGHIIKYDDRGNLKWQ